MKSASAYKLKERYLIYPEVKTTTGLWIASAPYAALPLDADAGALGNAVQAALARSAEGAPHPTDWRAASAPRLSAAGVRSERQFQLGASLIGITMDREKIHLLPHRNGGTMGREKGFYPLHELEVHVAASSNTNEIGARLLQALATLQGEPNYSFKPTPLRGAP